MLRSFRLGTALGIPLYVHSTFFLLPLWVALGSLSKGLGVVLFTEALLLTLFGCVLLHELGHALMARYFGIHTSDITLYPIGGVARMEGTGTTPWQEVCIALAGPAVNLVIVALLTPVLVVAWATPLLDGFGALDPTVNMATPLSLAVRFLTALWLCNGLLMAFNLLPAFPMDGGRVLRALLALSLGKLRATEIASALGLVLAVGLGLLALWTGTPTLLLVAVFVYFAGQMELRSLRRAEAEARAERARAQEAAQGFGTPGGFTGFAWDVHAGVWVRWQDGRPVDVGG